MSQLDPARTIRIHIEVPVGVEVATASSFKDRYTTTGSSPTADQTKVTSAGGKIPVTVTFSGNVSTTPTLVPSAIVQMPGAIIMTTPTGATPGVQNPDAAHWIWNAANNNAMSVVQTGPGVGAPNKLIIYWQNPTAVGVTPDWQLEALTFYAN
jgi:hypothetical protein